MSAEHRCDMTSGPHVPHLKTAKQKRAQVHHSRKRWPSQAKRSWNYTHTPWKGRLLVLLPLLPVIEAAITALCSFHNIKVVVMLFFALEEVTSASMHQCLILCTKKEVTKVGRSARFLEAFLTETTTSNLTNKQSNDVDGSVIQGAKYFTKQRLYHHVSQLKSVSSLPRWIPRS